MLIKLFGYEFISTESKPKEQPQQNTYYQNCVIKEPVPVYIQVPVKQEPKLNMPELIKFVAKRTGILEEWVERVIETASLYHKENEK
ncbi:MAG: hypothetical protein LCH52_08355 [Bacteroidetes bacterium]|nr:hypothetical protein [Bacteroidota bacterium]